MICLEFGHVNNPFHLKSGDKFIREQIIKLSK